MPDTSETVSASAQRHTGISRQVDKTLRRRLRMILALDDFEAPARLYLPRPMYGYVSGGAETNASLRANRAALVRNDMVKKGKSQQESEVGIDTLISLVQLVNQVKLSLGTEKGLTQAELTVKLN